MSKAAPEKTEENGNREIRIKDYLECRLTEKELKEAGKQLAEAINQKTQVEARVEAFKTQAKAEIAEKDATISKMSQLVNTEKEFRNVECHVVYDFKKGEKSYYRDDTGEIYKTALITNEERQK